MLVDKALIDTGLLQGFYSTHIGIFTLLSQHDPGSPIQHSLQFWPFHIARKPGPIPHFLSLLIQNNPDLPSKRD